MFAAPPALALADADALLIAELNLLAAELTAAVLELSRLEIVAVAVELSLKAVMEPVASVVSKEMLEREEEEAEDAALSEEEVIVAIMVTGFMTVLVRVVVSWARERVKSVVRAVRIVATRILTRVCSRGSEMYMV